MRKLRKPPISTLFFFSSKVTLTSQPFSSHRMASNAVANDDDWEKAEGVPSLSDPFIQKYLSGRDALVEQEKKQRSGR